MDQVQNQDQDQNQEEIFRSSQQCRGFYFEGLTVLFVTEGPDQEFQLDFSPDPVLQNQVHLQFPPPAARGQQVVLDFSGPGWSFLDGPDRVHPVHQNLVNLVQTGLQGFCGDSAGSCPGLSLRVQWWFLWIRTEPRTSSTLQWTERTDGGQVMSE